MIEHRPGHHLGRAYLASWGVITYRWCWDCRRHVPWPRTRTLDALDWRRDEVQR